MNIVFFCIVAGLLLAFCITALIAAASEGNLGVFIVAIFFGTLFYFLVSFMVREDNSRQKHQVAVLPVYIVDNIPYVKKNKELINVERYYINRVATESDEFVLYNYDMSSAWIDFNTDGEFMKPKWLENKE